MKTADRLRTDTPATNARETADIETASDDYARRFAGPVGAWFLRVQADATLRLLAPYRGGTVLDVGGGHGQLTRPLIDAGYRVAVQGSAPICRGRIQPLLDAGMCSFQVSDILELPYPDRSFDAVISFRLLPHVTRWRELVAELSRVARGAVVVDFPVRRGLNALTPGLFGMKKRLEGNTRTYLSFDEREVIEAFAPHGFRPAESFAEFFLPMVVHRVVGRPAIAARAEGLSRALGLTARLGSPVILKLMRQGS